MARWFFFGKKSAPHKRKPASHRLTIEALEDRTLLSVNPIVAENLLPGSPQSQWDVAGAGDPALQGFATDISVNQGQTVNFKVNDTALAQYHIEIYRMGYYQGLGARQIAVIPASQTIAKVQPNPLKDLATGLVDCGNWTVTASWAVPSNATSGIYFAKLKRDDTGGASHVFFIVRADSSHSQVLFQTSDSTWEAYNDYGGNSLYVGTAPSSDGRAYKVSYNRPFNDRATGGGLGTYNWVFHAEYPMVRWLESNGYDVSYFTDVDSDRNGALIKNHQVFMSVGHDEYWSGGQRANVEAARDAGVNLAFFSGNEGFWKTRWETSIDGSGTAYRTLVCYKETKVEQKIDPLPNVWTGTWRDPTLSPPEDGGRPENALSGTIFMVNRGPIEIGSGMSVPAAFANLRFWRNTSVANLTGNQVATLGSDILGYEWDVDQDNGFRPYGLFDLSSTTQAVPQLLVDYGNDYEPGTATHSLTLYRAKSGALVFGAGTVQWSWGLDGNHDDGTSPPESAIQQATVNLLADMNVQPTTLQAGLVLATPTTDITAPTTTITAPSGGASIVAGSTVTISGTATDSGGVVAGVEVSVDGGQTWHPAVGRTNWTYTWVPSTAGPVIIQARGVDDSGNLASAPANVTVTVTYAPTSTTGLVAAYGFNEGSGSTVADLSGHNNSGSISGAAWVPGISGNALSYNGLSDWVTVNDSSTLDLTNGMTLEAWVKPTAAFTDWSAVMMKERTNGLVYALYASDGANQPPGGFVQVSNNDHSVGGLAVLPVNAWSHLAATYDGTNLLLYVNGSLVGSTPVGGNITTSNGVLRIGGDSVWGEFFKGIIDEVRIYNRALNAGEIRSDMSTPVGGSLDAIAPTISISSPTSGASVSNVTTLSVNASDNTLVAGVKYFLTNSGGTTIQLGQEVTTAPFSYAWDTRTLPNGSYTLTATARDYAGNTTTAAAVNLTISNGADTTPPSVTLLNPLDVSMAGAGTVILWAVASDNVGVSNVQFKVNGSPLGGPVSTAPYRVAWATSSVANGNYDVTAVALDAAGNITTSNVVHVTVDKTAPSIVSVTPADGSTGISTAAPATATFSEAIQPGSFSFVVKDPSNNSVFGSTLYDDATNTATFSHGSIALDPLTTYTATITGARDLAGNVMPTFSWQFTTAPTITNATIWTSATLPAVESENDPSPVEVGVKFRSDLAGAITGIRFYKGGANTGTHVAHLWSSTGTLLATATFTGESAAGWQQVNFSAAVPINPNTTYIASYFAPNGGYAADSGYFATSGVDSGPLHALSNSAGGGNGVYTYDGGFPTNTFNSANYWVDVVFGTGTTDITPPTVISQSPAPGATGVPQTSGVTATFSEPVLSNTISFVLKDQANNAVAATLTYDATTRKATLTPTLPLADATAYTATVSGAQDQAGNVMTSPVSWSFTTATAITAPDVIYHTPASGDVNVPTTTEISATLNEDVQPGSINFVLKDGNNQTVAATLVYTNDDIFKATLVPDVPLASNTTYTATVSGLIDLSGRPMAAPVSWSFTTSDSVTTASIWSPITTPAVDSANDPSAVELGVKFRSDAPGYITGIRFYKGAANTGTHVGSLWTATGTLLGSATFTNESATGWQQVVFADPVAIAADTTYVASYFAPVGGYSYNSGYFATGVNNGALHALANGVDGGNGVFRYGGGFPNNTFNSSNYWVDVLFTTSAADTTPPTVVSQTPASGSTGIAKTATVTAGFSEPVQHSTISFVLKDQAGNIVPSSTVYNTATYSVTLTPNSALAASTTYTATVNGAKDLSGNTMAPVSWSFTTVVVAGSTIWLDTATPAGPSNDPFAAELGVKFRSDVGGAITGLRFYKGAGNTGVHVGHLWSASGTLLGSATFTVETASGWQQVNFASPIMISPNVTYIASYFAPAGNYSYSAGYFTSSGVDSGSLHALSDSAGGGNGVFVYGGGFPTSSSNASNYWVDVVFTTAVPPTITSQSPAPNATEVSVQSGVSVTFNTPMDASSINTSTFRLRANGASSDVPATVSYNGSVALLQPTAPLALNTTYQVTISGSLTNSAGLTLGADATWSFTTVTTPYFSDTTSADFAAGSVGPGLSVVESGNGDLILTPAFDAEFSGASLPAGWTSSNWAPGGSVTVSGGAMTVDGAMAQGGTLFAPGRSLEFVATFTGDPFQHGGFTVDFSNSTWAMFSTMSGGGLFARSAGPNGATDTPIPGNWFGAPHLFRIDWNPTGVTYSIDGVVVASHTVVVPGNLQPAFSDANSGAGKLQVDWVRLTPYASAGSFLSRVFDAGAAVTWLDAPWHATTPAGSSVAVSFRMGNTPTPDSTWTDFFPVSSGATLGGFSRYIQYRADLATNDTGHSPTLQDVRINYTAAADTIAPTIVRQFPAPNSSGFDLYAPISVTFGELMDASTISQATFRLRAVGAGSDLPATVTYAGSTATLTPLDPLAYSTLYQVTASGTIKDASGNSLGADVTWTFTSASPNETIPPTVLSTTPTAGSTTVPLTANMTATFSEEVQASTINFTLTDAGGNPVAALVTFDPSTRTVTLDPAPLLAPDTTYTASLSGAKDLSGNTMASMSWNFKTTTADSTPPTLSSFAPAAGATGVAVGANLTATFSKLIQANTINFTLTAGATTIPGTAVYDPSTGIVTFDPTGNLAPATYTASVSGAKDMSGNTMLPATWSFTTAPAADSTPPTISSTSPAAGAIGIAVGANVTATFSEPVQSSTIVFSLKAGATTIPSALTYDAVARIATLDPTGNLAPSTTYTATVTAQDLSGNTMAPVTWTFTTAALDTTAPTLTSRAPASGATGVAVSSQVTATFSEVIDPSTISFNLTAGAATIPAIVTYNAATRVVTLDPTGNLASSTTYTATLSGVQDLSGNTMSTLAWSFTTAAADTSAPTVTTRSPAVGATNVALGTNVTATFNETVQASTILFTLMNGATTIPAAVTYNPATGVATLDPTGNLAPLTTYTATLSGTSDLSGNTMTPVSWTFTTQAAADATAPTVTSRSPGVNATGVFTDSNVTATFSESVQASTITFTLANGGNTVVSTVVYDASARMGSLRPTAVLANSTTYTATLSGAKDLSGNVMTPLSWSFTTAAVPSSPYVTSRSPVPNAISVAAGSNITATFNAAMSSSSISSSTFVLRDSSNNTVPASVSYSSSSRTATLNPTNNLAFPASYTATLSGVRDASGNVMPTVSWTFTTTGAADTNKPSISSRSPASSATGVALGSNVTATLSEDVQASTISFTLKIGSGTPLAADVTYNAATRTVTLDPNVDLAPSTTYTATLSGAKDLSGNTMNSGSWTFTTAAADTTKPTISTRTPASGATGVTLSSSVSATFSEAVQASTIAFTLRIGVGSPLAGVMSYDSASNTFTFDPDVVLSPSTTYTAMLSGARDLSGNMMNASTWSFTTAALDTTPPAISTRSPSVGAGGIATGSNVTVTFNEDVKPGTINFTLKIGSGSPLAAVVSYDPASRTVTLDPNVALAPSTTYTATLSGVRDLAENTLTTTSWSFTTAAVADGTPPSLSSQSPAPGATGIGTGSNVSVTFTEDVQASTISATLQAAGGGPLAAVVTYDAATRTVTLDPNATLAPATVYTATISGAMDLAGNTMLPVSWTFTTAPAAADTTPPTISARTPGSGATSVARGSNVTATFSEDIQLATIVFSLTAGATTIPALASYNPTTRTLTLDPDVMLAPLTTYTVAVSGGQDASGNTMAPVSWSFTTGTGDVTAPTATSITPASGATAISINTSVSATFSEQIQASTISLVLLDGLNRLLPATVSYDLATRIVTLTPAVPLAYSATYTASLSGARDLANNIMAPLTWSFTTDVAPTSAAQQWVQTLAADFNAGTQNGTVVLNTSGDVQLAPQFIDDFVGTTLGAAWVPVSLSNPSSALVSGGVLALQSTEVHSVQTYPVNTAVEGLINFGASPSQHFGLATSLSDASGNSWAIFSTGGTSDTLFARVNVNGVTTDVSLGALPSGWHDYLIRPTAGGFDFVVDGVVLTTVAASFAPGTLTHIALSDLLGAAPIQADWIRIPTNSGSGTFMSSILDAHKFATWGIASWTAALPPGTSIVVETRSGYTATPDASWSDWSAVANGATVASPSGEFLQYRITLVSSDPLVTPTLFDITINWS